MVVIAWNILFFIDRKVLGFPVAGPFSVVALALVAALSFTVPRMRLPGSWIVKEECFVKRWRYVFWYVGFLVSGMAAFVVYDLVFGLHSLPG